MTQSPQAIARLSRFLLTGMLAAVFTATALHAVWLEGATPDASQRSPKGAPALPELEQRPLRPTTRPTSGPVFGALTHFAKPTLNELGLAPITVLYEDSLLTPGSGSAREPQEEKCRAMARHAASAGHLISIDIECWPVDIRSSPREQVEQSIQKLAKVADWIHAERPGLRIGFYDILPLRDYWTPVRYLKAMRDQRQHSILAAQLPEFRSEYVKWCAANDFVGERLARHVDIVFPSLYQHYLDADDWELYAQANLAEAERFGKAVFPFLCFRFVGSDPSHGNHYLPAALWRRQLDYCALFSDGPVIWGGFKERWDSTLEWWVETRGFLESNAKDSSRARGE